MEKSIRVRILGREYGLLVEESEEKQTKVIAAYLDEKMRSFRDSHPDQQDVTTAVIAGLAVAEELFTYRNGRANEQERLESQLDDLTARLDQVLHNAA